MATKETKERIEVRVNRVQRLDSLPNKFISKNKRKATPAFVDILKLSSSNYERTKPAD